MYAGYLTRHAPNVTISKKHPDYETWPLARSRWDSRPPSEADAARPEWRPGGHKAATKAARIALLLARHSRRAAPPCESGKPRDRGRTRSEPREIDAGGGRRSARSCARRHRPNETRPLKIEFGENGVPSIGALLYAAPNCLSSWSQTHWLSVPNERICARISLCEFSFLPSVCWWCDNEVGVRLPPSERRSSDLTRFPRNQFS